MARGRVEALHRTPSKRGELESLLDAVVVADRGIDGDHHVRAGSSRQVVLVEAETLDALDLKPGQIREQLCVRGIPGIGAGDVLEIGAVRLEVVKPRVPCQMMDGVRPGLRREREGRGGWCARAVAGGHIAVGDAVTVGHVDDPDWIDDFRDALATYEAAPPTEREGWDLREELARLIGRNERGVRQLESGIADSGAADSSDAEAVARLVTPEATTSVLYRLHDVSATAVVDAARVHRDQAEKLVRSLATYYRECAAECA